MSGYLNENILNGDHDHNYPSVYVAGAKLIRFTNRAGALYSGIYDKDNYEVWSCERHREDRMVKEWNKTYGLPSQRQYCLAIKISQALNIQLPQKHEGLVYSQFISQHINEYKELKENGNATNHN